MNQTPKHSFLSSCRRFLATSFLLTFSLSFVTALAFSFLPTDVFAYDPRCKTDFNYSQSHQAECLVVANEDCSDGKLCNPIKFPNLTAFFLEIVNTVVQYGALLIVFFIVFAGFKFVTAQGNSEKVSEARKMLTWVIVGAFVLLGVYVIRAAICGTIGQLGITNVCEEAK
ncbi:MAG: hypothetical protein A2849_00100 [Candidatus Taylorbacteria bacterium RIFCSPHIGHO2_01_FULL_51_15]|uniref:Uncharacterized protein n=1 Tax=Candidatus Taylorbacteria bacterium RIFCSPHIGHO2_01_FULL_51_15 TaxID=1802304 RepID=A0A1G2MCE9_9BACT|nr:MAG: hypothetical protein A2849_00100 [Candidatus Taylorbacteria bacterium RIFCSPHIGHO2_01_FULL_51_15]